MVTLVIHVNGQPFCETADLATVTMTVEQRTDESCRITLDAAEGDRAVQWLTAALRAGDEVVLRAVESSEIDAAPPVCGFCGRDANDVQSLITGSGGAMCDQCARAIGAAVGRGTPLPLGAVFGGPDATCGFCRREASAAGGVVVRNGVGICGECLRACEEVAGGSTG